MNSLFGCYPGYTIRHYFSLEDGVHAVIPSSTLNLPFYAANENLTWSQIFQAYGLTAFDDAEELNVLLQNYIYPRFWNVALCYVDMDNDESSPETNEVKEAFVPVIGKIWAWLNGTRDKMILLIKSYKEQESKLLDQIKVSSTTLFNDTPQNAGDFTTDNHTTTATKTETNSDIATPMARLKEIQDHLEMLYNDWSDDFRKFIIQ